MNYPFPGMDPFLEGRINWKGFHNSLCVAMRDRLNEVLSDDFRADIEEHLYLRTEDDETVTSAYADVGGRGDALSAGGAALAEGPLVVEVPPYEEPFRQLYLHVLDDADRIVAVIEALSPTNKRPGPKRDDFLEKRNSLIHSDVGYVEIDLLRGWPPMPFRPPADCDYRILVSDPTDLPRASLWPVGLRDRLPDVPVPLPGGTAVGLPLQSCVETAWRGGRYAPRAYREPPAVAISADDRDWTAQRLDAAGIDTPWR